MVSKLLRAAPLLTYLFVITAAILTVRYHFVNVQITLPQEKYDLFLISSYYYEQSKSLGDNAIALVLTGDYETVTTLQTIKLAAYNVSSRIVVDAELQRITPHYTCKWISMLVTVPLLPNLKKLEISTGREFAMVPFTLPVRKKYDVVSCIAPLFANEQWQIALFAVHTYRRFGSHMHLYVRSMVSPLFELIKEYEKENYLTVQPWLRVELPSIAEENFNPNLNIEFRNQAAAQTDCLLQYKESAKFITFVDLDDILFPRLGKTYFEEYEHLFNHQSNIAYIHYAKRNAHVQAKLRGEDFSLVEMFDSIQLKDEYETGKLVTRPENLNSTWIHWPSVIPPGTHEYNVPPTTNSITHLKRLDRTSGRLRAKNEKRTFYSALRWQIFDEPTLVKSADVTAIQKDFRRMMLKPSVQYMMESMPTDFYYYDLIDKCFHETFYVYHSSGKLHRMKCPGPERCKFPNSTGISCYNSISNYESREGEILSVHFHKKDGFREEEGCGR